MAENAIIYNADKHPINNGDLAKNQETLNNIFAISSSSPLLTRNIIDIDKNA